MKLAQGEPEGFAEFWTIWRPYQRATDGRGKARQPYAAKLASGANPADIIDGARWYLRNLKERDKEFIPLASTWLNSERWADDCELERQHQSRVKAQEEQRRGIVETAPTPARRLTAAEANKIMAEAGFRSASH